LKKHIETEKTDLVQDVLLGKNSIYAIEGNLSSNDESLNAFNKVQEFIQTKFHQKKI